MNLLLAHPGLAACLLAICQAAALVLAVRLCRGGGAGRERAAVLRA